MQVELAAGKKRPGATKTRLHFIDHQRALLLVTQLAQPQIELGRELVDTAFALNRFHQHGGNRTERQLQHVQVFAVHCRLNQWCVCRAGNACN
ncbi:hypothetical protein D9M71_491980 [compost metagenome]